MSDFALKVPNWMRTAFSRDPGWSYERELEFAIEYVLARRFNSRPDDEQDAARRDLVEALAQRLGLVQP